MPVVRNGRFRSRVSPLTRTVRRAAGLAATAATEVVRRNLASRLATRTGVSYQSAPLTGYSDYKVDYKKRKLTRRSKRVIFRKRKWTRKVVRAVRESTTGSAHVVRSSFAPGRESPANGSAWFSATIYGLNGTNDPNINCCNDLGQAFFNADSTAWTNWDSNGPVLDSRSQRIEAFHATMEFTMLNTGANDVLAEVYFIRARKRTERYYTDPSYVYETGFSKQDTTREPDSNTLMGSALAASQMGVTPFQNSLFCRTFNIIKRVKHRIQAGGEVSFIHRDARTRWFTLKDTKAYSMSNATSGVLVQFQGVPVAGGAPSAAAPAQLTFTVQRRYRFKFLSGEMSTDARW